MTVSHCYVGCDISKHHIDLYDLERGRLWRIANEESAVSALAAELSGTNAFVVLEATGSHDRLLRRALASKKVPFKRVNPMMARRFGEACGRRAKTDALDARMLAELGAALLPQADPAPSATCEQLTALTRRRDQLVTMRAMEKVRLHEAHDAVVEDSLVEMIAILGNKIAELEEAIQLLIKADDKLAARERLLATAPGIGPVAATTLLALMPELGSVSPKRIAALAGLAPFNRDSGRMKGKRSIAGGRARVRRALYMAALAAVRSCKRMKRFYDRVVSTTGAKKPALIAVARKLLTCLNAMVRDQKAWT